MCGYLLQHLLEHSARKYPDNVAVVFKEKSVTYSELEQQSNDLARKLQQSGIKKGDRVGIMLSKSIETIVSLFGILKSGAIYVPIDPSAPVNRITYIIKHCGIECLIASSPNLNTLLSDSEEQMSVTKAIVVGKDHDESRHLNILAECLPFYQVSDNGDSEFQSVEMSDSSPAYILHTSGSTGNPKGVAISHLNALTFVEMAARFFKISETDRFCNHAPLHFDLSVFDIFVAVKCGAAIVLLPELLSTFPVKLSEFIAKEQITIWNSVSSVLTMLADKGMLERHSFDALRIVHFSGDIMPAKYLRVLTKHMGNASFFNIYGQTEANSSMFYPIGELPDDDAWRIPIGRPFPNFEVFALNDAGEVISRVGEDGELYVGSSTVALGYWGEEWMTGDKFVPDPRYPVSRKIVYKTGDLVRIDGHGNYVFSGRKDNMVKSRGYRIELEEIETVLSSHPEIMAAVVLPIPDELVGNRIVAVIVPMSNRTVGKEDVVRHCATRLPKYMMPEIMEFRDSLPMTSSGKIDRKTLAGICAGNYRHSQEDSV
ncbi:amino acid adenylation domain-containing protein [Geotalea uraniireducens]|uniref:Amino acid adenylation domain n=1 Tax=Geotalea uraniireducens (strain Rf4) TaxID=351605 RepID=A5G412_GEOUR|nr:amino acid adenylation domain-containing protein [Geotalea uraniireducens]ABQ26530.1 amino acid adenylation domain [Geotalea uraniireducens Rf4]